MKLLETILMDGGQPCHLNYHQMRLEKSLKTLFETPRIHDLQKIIPNKDTKEGLLRCRVLYDEHTAQVTFHPYTPLYKKAFYLKEIDFSYDFKFADRTAIDAAMSGLSEESDAIFVKNGLITDTSIANIAIWEKGAWLTPAKPLLEGTTRARLLNEKKLVCADITVKDLKKAEKIALFNALTGFYEVTSAKIF